MATLVFFHAHPDDESTGTGGTIAKASAQGHRVIVVVATKGEHGTRRDDLLDPGEELSQRRVAETKEAARILGVHRLEFLSYRDSGMMGSPANDDPGSFWAADLDTAARHLAAILRRERADVVAIYDQKGITGHPDHVQVHRVGLKAAELARTPEVVEGTMSRSQVARLILHAMTRGATGMTLDVDLAGFGIPDDAITDRVDVRDYLEKKRRAMAAHTTQISATSLFLTMPPDTFEAVWGHECMILRGRRTTSFDQLLAAGQPLRDRGGSRGQRPCHRASGTMLPSSRPHTACATAGRGASSSGWRTTPEWRAGTSRPPGW